MVVTIMKGKAKEGRPTPAPILKAANGKKKTKPRTMWEPHYSAEFHRRVEAGEVSAVLKEEAQALAKWGDAQGKEKLGYEPAEWGTLRKRLEKHIAPDAHAYTLWLGIELACIAQGLKPADRPAVHRQIKALMQSKPKPEE